MSTLSPTISKTALQALTELTGEPRANVALLLTLQDAVAYRLGIVRTAIASLEQKHGMSFEEFEAQGRAEAASDQFAYDVERDYFEWDGLISRKQKLETIEAWLI